MKKLDGEQVVTAIKEMSLEELESLDVSTLTEKELDDYFQRKLKLEFPQY